MKTSLEIQGEIYDNMMAICDRYGIAIRTFHKWRRKGMLSDPLKIGISNYYKRSAVEEKLIGRNSSPAPAPVRNSSEAATVVEGI